MRSQNGAFTFRTDPYHDRLLDALSAYLQRTKSDTIRFILREKGENVGLAVLLRNERQHACQETMDSPETMEVDHAS